MRASDIHENSSDGARGSVARAAEPAGRDGACDSAPRVVTTGGKIDEAAGGAFGDGMDSETGESLIIYGTGGHGIKAVRQVIADETASGALAQLDALAFTVRPPEDDSMRWVLDQMAQFLPIEDLQERNGCFGFKQSLRFGEGAGLIAWGGSAQRGRVYFSIQGKGCSLVRDWPGLATWLEANAAKLARVDVAHDDLKGQAVSIAWAIEQYRAGGFKAGGRQPQHGVHGDWLAEESSKGRTLGIGARSSGKYCRIYEKGKQLGEPESPWTRIEVEWRGKDRRIPYDILTRPGSYLAGAFPCMAFLSAEQSRIRTVANAATITFDAAVEHARIHVGKLAGLMLRVYGGDYVEVVRQLKRDGMPSRIEPFSYELADCPERLDRSSPAGYVAQGLIE